MIISIILILLAIDTLGKIIFGVKENQLNCGIFAWAGKSTKKFNKQKLDILGIMNETRGTDSCGITVDGDIYLGVDKEKAYRDFLSNIDYDKPINFPVVIGHTRKSTVGANTMDNAHPFGFGFNNDGFSFIGVHNGSLLNYKDLAKDFNVDEVQTLSKGNTRNKIDSEILLECIYKNSNYKVLSKYNGAAALVFTDTREPNVIYCYHGASKKYNTDKGDVIYQERPLFYYKETRNSLYISSIEDSLIAIGGNPDTIGEFSHNVVYRIVDGNVEKATKFSISRKNCHHLKTYRYQNYHQNYGRTYPNYDACSGYDTINFDKSKGTSTNISSSSLSDKKNIYNEKTLKDLKDYKGKVYFNKLRYWRNGHTITGVYAWITNYGFYKLGDNTKEAENTFWSLVNIPFKNNCFQKNKKNSKKGFIPFVHNKNQEITDISRYFFYIFEGARISTQLDFDACISLKKERMPFDVSSLSLCTVHPIIDMSYKYKDSNRQSIYYGGELFTGIISPLNAEKIYEIDKGNCTRITNIAKIDDVKVIELPASKNLDTVVDDLEKEENTKKDNIENDRLEKLIEETLLEPYQLFPIVIKRLSNFKSNEKRDSVMKLLSNFIESTSKIIEIEKKTN